jgi:hypothetical protein
MQNLYHQSAAAVTSEVAAMTITPKTTISAGQKPAFYCWSHGFGRNKDHTSATCKNQAPGHCLTATYFNMQGGCPLIHRQKNEPTVWKQQTKVPKTPGPN